MQREQRRVSHVAVAADVEPLEVGDVHCGARKDSKPAISELQEKFQSASIWTAFRFEPDRGASRLLQRCWAWTRSPSLTQQPLMWRWRAEELAPTRALPAAVRLCAHRKEKTQPPTSCISGCSAELFLLSAELHWISGIVVVRSGSPASQEECVQKKKKKKQKQKKLLKGGDRSVSGEARKRHRLYFLWKILLHISGTAPALSWTIPSIVGEQFKMHWPDLTFFICLVY